MSAETSAKKADSVSDISDLSFGDDVGEVDVTPGDVDKWVDGEEDWGLVDTPEMNPLSSINPSGSPDKASSPDRCKPAEDGKEVAASAATNSPAVHGKSTTAPAAQEGPVPAAVEPEATDQQPLQVQETKQDSSTEPAAEQESTVITTTTTSSSTTPSKACDPASSSQLVSEAEPGQQLADSDRVASVVVEPTAPPPLVAAHPTESPSTEEIQPATPSGQQQQANELQEGDDEYEFQQEGEEGSGGWGWGLPKIGLGSLGTKLKQVAAGAVSDMKELTESFQQALANTEDDEEDQDGSSTQGREEVAEEGSPAAPPLDPQILNRLQGRDTQLEVGLKAIDDQVEHLAVGAAKALGSIWGGLSKVAKGVATNITVVTSEVAKGLAGEEGDEEGEQAKSSSVFQGVSTLGATLESSLKTVRRTAMGIIEEVTGQPGRGAEGYGDDDPVSFEDFFHLYGGMQLSEELEELANDCSRTCNKARARLEASQQADLDALLTKLAPLFNDELTGGQGQQALPSLTDAGSATFSSMQKRYEPIKILCQDSADKADAFLDSLKGAARYAAAAASPAPTAPSVEPSADPAAAAPPAEGQEAGPAAAGDRAEGESEQGAPGSSATLLADSIVQVLLDLKLHASKRVAEICTSQMQLMLIYARSLSGPARGEDDAAEGTQAGSISWPLDVQQVAAVLRCHAHEMLSDLQDVASNLERAAKAFIKSEEFAELDQHEGVTDQVVSEATSVMHDVKGLGSMAKAQTEEAFRCLLYVVLLRGLVLTVAE